MARIVNDMTQAMIAQVRIPTAIFADARRRAAELTLETGETVNEHDVIRACARKAIASITADDVVRRSTR